MSEHIVVGMDAGEPVDAVVGWVADRLEHSKEPAVVTLTAIARPWDDREQAEVALRRARQVLGTPASVHRVVELTRHGDPAAELVAAASSAALLAVGTAPLPLVASITHASLALKLAGRTPCPLIVVPAGWAPHRGPVVAAWTDDGSAETVVARAAAEADRAGVELEVIHSWDLPSALGLDEGARRDRPLRRAAETAELASVIAEAQATHPALDISESVNGRGAYAVLRGRSASASLIVVGSHGRGAIADFLVGSVGDDLIRTAKCPIMILPSASAT